jgi:hypothetical protein
MGLRPRSVPLGLPSGWGGSPLTPFAVRSVESAIVRPGIDGHKARLVTNWRSVQLFCFTMASNWRRTRPKMPTNQISVSMLQLCWFLYCRHIYAQLGLRLLLILFRVLAAWLLSVSSCLYLDLCSLDSEVELFVKCPLYPCGGSWRLEGHRSQTQLRFLNLHAEFVTEVLGRQTPDI